MNLDTSWWWWLPRGPPWPTAPGLAVGLSLGDGQFVGQEWAGWEGTWSLEGAEGDPEQLRGALVCLHPILEPKGNLQRLFLTACGYVAVELTVIQTAEHISGVPWSYINFYGSF